MDNPEKPVTLGTQDTVQRQTKQKTKQMGNTHHQKLNRWATLTPSKTKQMGNTHHQKLNRWATLTPSKTKQMGNTHSIKN